MLCLPMCCLQALLLKSHTLPLPHYCQTHQEMVPPFGAHYYVCMWTCRHIHKNSPAYVCVILSVFMQVLVLVCYLFSSAWCLLAIHYSCFFFPHTTCFFTLFRLFPPVFFQLLFPCSFPSVFAPSSTLMSCCQPSPAVWTRWLGIYL